MKKTRKGLTRLARDVQNDTTPVADVLTRQTKLEEYPARTLGVQALVVYHMKTERMVKRPRLERLPNKDLPCLVFQKKVKLLAKMRHKVEHC